MANEDILLANLKKEKNNNNKNNFMLLKETCLGTLKFQYHRREQIEARDLKAK